MSPEQRTLSTYRCPACGVDGTQVIVRLAGLHALVQCPACEHRYTVPLWGRA